MRQERAAIDEHEQASGRERAAATMVALTLLCAVVAAAAPAAVSGSSEIPGAQGTARASGALVYVALVAGCAALLVVVALGVAGSVRGRRRRGPDDYELVFEPPPVPLAVKIAFMLAPLVALAAVVAAAVATGHHGVGGIGFGTGGGSSSGGSRQAAQPQRPSSPGSSAGEDDIAALIGGAAALVVLGGGAVLLRSLRGGEGEPLPPRLPEPASALMGAIEQSLDDLRDASDLRRAIIAAYARMESALAEDGLPRRPSEAPREYLARVLARARVSPLSAERLTDLYVEARFSRHAIRPAMRDEAIDAVHAIRADMARP